MSAAGSLLWRVPGTRAVIYVGDAIACSQIFFFSVFQQVSSEECDNKLAVKGII
jgi:hypothetical protein